MFFFSIPFLFLFTGCSPTAHIHQEITTDIYAQFPLREHETIQCAFYSRLVYQALKKTPHFAPLENFAETYDKRQSSILDVVAPCLPGQIPARLGPIFDTHTS